MILWKMFYPANNTGKAMKTKSVLSGLFIKIYPHALNPVRRLIEQYLSHAEGGWYFSETLREIYQKVHGLKIGIGTYGCFIPSRFPRGTQIGNYCSIARNVTVLNANHPMERASMHPMFYDPELGAPDGYALDRSNLTIGSDVWIGQDVIITKGCTRIGNGAIIGAGSIVTKNVEPYTIIAGNPAGIIRKRFHDDVIACLEDSKWYDLSPKKLIAIADTVGDPVAFAKKAKEIADHECC